MAANTSLVRVTWECPLCGTRRSSIQQAVNERRGRNGLLNHIRHTDDDDHGEWRSVPDSLSQETIEACLTVESVSLGVSDADEGDDA
ncbi:hypothetical protein [Halogranum rubrum]|uniref:Uncharacterized protein n=1 Tax=Halogranum salarium B-1 TaxID=1210908 RepID=J2ZVR6_9EURY|nr:hypothetical protein [Halogranum salarium]EJN57123.1 hypothetical protein HSB1_45090 [Halogranum salarium B-1]